MFFAYREDFARLRGALVATALILTTTPSLADYDDPVPMEVPGTDTDVPIDGASHVASPTTKHWELGAGASYVTPPIRGGTSPFGVGFGARFGFNVAHLYLGVDFDYYLGGTDVTLSDQAMRGGGLVGYSITLREFPGIHSTLVLRPLVGVGDVAISHTDPSLLQNVQTVKPDVVTTASGRTVTTGGGRFTPSDTTTLNNIYVSPALSLMFVGNWYFIALEASMLVIPGIGYGGADPTTWISYGARAQLGARF